MEGCGHGNGRGRCEGPFARALVWGDVDPHGGGLGACKADGGAIVIEVKYLGVVCMRVCVFITAGPSTKLFACVWGGYWRTCATRDDEPRPVWTSLCLFITAGPSTL